LDVYISNNEKIELFSENEQQIILGPREEKKIFWKVKVSEDLDKNYYYTLPVQIYTLQGVNEKLNIEAKKGMTHLSEGDVNSVILDMGIEEDKTYSKGVDLNCNYEKFAYTGEIVEVVCSIVNTGNIFIKDLNVNDELIDLGIGQSKEINFEIEAGVSMKVSAKNKDINKVEYLNIEVLDYPVVEISNLDYPNSIKYGDVFNVKFSVNGIKGGPPLNVRINMANRIQEFFIEELVGGQNVNVEMMGSSLDEGENMISIVVNYEDLRGKEYVVSENIVLILEDLTLVQKVSVWFNKANRWLNGLFS